MQEHEDRRSGNPLLRQSVSQLPAHYDRGGRERILSAAESDMHVEIVEDEKPLQILIIELRKAFLDLSRLLCLTLNRFVGGDVNRTRREDGISIVHDQVIDAWLRNRESISGLRGDVAARSLKVGVLLASFELLK